MTQKEAKELTLELWRYLAEHPECYEKNMVQHDLFDKLKHLYRQCALCEAFHNSKFGCGLCPLYIADEYCFKVCSAWDRWANVSVYDLCGRKEAANQIVKIVSAWEPEDE